MASDRLLTIDSVRDRTDDDVRAENRRLRALLGAMARAVPSAAALVEVGWTEDGRLEYIFCVPGENELAATQALIKVMSKKGFPWGAAREMAIEGARIVLARHGLTKEAQEECREVAVRMIEAAKKGV